MIKAIVTDIEGTTSSLSFVKDVLFPYARKALPDFIAAHGKEPEIAALLDDVRRLEKNPALAAPQIAEIMQRWIDEDKKITPLKTLQGFIWEQGFRQGIFKSQMYKDAIEGLQRWHTQGLPLYVYSSGSVHAQKLLFGHSERGDLTPLFSGYFDTTIGGKLEANSYRAIAQAIKQPPAAILFLSDHVGELDAAREAGMQTVLLDRDELVKDGHKHCAVNNFNAIKLEGVSHAACA